MNREFDITKSTFFLRLDAEFSRAYSENLNFVPGGFHSHIFLEPDRTLSKYIIFFGQFQHGDLCLLEIFFKEHALVETRA
jgi:hypothetical protein